MQTILALATVQNAFKNATIKKISKTTQNADLLIQQKATQEKLAN